jgi:hypothetical protein
MPFMKVVAILAILALVFAMLAPGISLGDASLRLARSGASAVRSVVSILPRFPLRSAFFRTYWLAIRELPSMSMAPAPHLYEIDCTWIC